MSVRVGCRPTPDRYKYRKFSMIYKCLARTYFLTGCSSYFNFLIDELGKMRLTGRAGTQKMISLSSWEVPIEYDLGLDCSQRESLGHRWEQKASFSYSSGTPAVSVTTDNPYRFPIAMSGVQLGIPGLFGDLRRPLQGTAKSILASLRLSIALALRGPPASRLLCTMCALNWTTCRIQRQMI